MLKKKLQDSRFLMGTHLFIVLLGLAWIALSIKLNDKFEQFNWYYLIGIGVLLVANTVLWFRTPPTDRKPKLNKLFLILGFAEIILTTGLLIGFFILYFKFSTINLSELAWLMHADITGTNISTFYGDIIRGVIALILIIVAYFGLFRLAKKRNKQSRFVLWCFTVFFAGFCIVSGMHYKHLMVGEYLRNIGKYSPFIEDNYVDAGKVDITFKEKRNLIYIYLESMEPTFAGIENGGATQEDIIPELTAIAQENMDFGEGSALNGAYALNGATYTMGAMAAMTSGVGVSEDFFDNHIRNNVWEKDEYVTDYLPGVWSLGQVLEENGYKNMLMIGSKAGFSGRDVFFTNHGNYEIFDYDTAVERGYIPEDYYRWWGFEDAKLYEYARDEVTKLAAADEPFNLTLLTVDTHFTGGYVCQLCGNKYDEQYSNVYACASKQLSDFLEWIKQQDFYENTTVIIAGDHPTMDTEYISKMGISDEYERKSYIAVINPAKDCVERPRVYTTFDMYPTTLASIGATIQGDRLGLGTNLFSDKPTLIEKYGYQEMSTQLLQRSLFYEQNLAGRLQK
ncbi:LTA synthase family protein [Butyrivibrio sp. AE3009]|uniref:LTA synthase family protein n=1 Tax=Butyrivibrio sp. AE3009 TaxID=1280666 RepID=UPI0003B47623|nr:LTA synthase family protein [Butyrivibrio sp. AE3009]